MAAATGQAQRSEITQMLGELWSFPGTHEKRPEGGPRMVLSDYGDGTWICDERPFIALRPTMPGWMVRMGDILKRIGSHNLLATPAPGGFRRRGAATAPAAFPARRR